VLNWFGAAGLEPQHLSTCNDLSVILRLVASGEGVSLLPPAILATELRTGALEIFRSRPAIAGSRLYAAYQVDKLRRSVSTVLDTARHVIARSSLLAPQ